MQSSERTVSVWERTRPRPQYPPLVGDHEADVAVVGAGLAGMTVAYLLAKAGRRVVVLDDNAVGGGETGQTTAHLSSALDDHYHVLEKVHGRDGARLAYESHHAAIETIGRIAAEEGIDCDYARLDGWWFVGAGNDPRTLDREAEAARRLGIPGVERAERVPGVPFDSGPALRFPGQGQFHPLKYLEGLARCILRDGGRIHTGNHVTGVESGRVAGEGFSVRAPHVAVCTNSPISDRVALHTKQAPYRTFAIAARLPAGAVARPALWWDTLEAYHYVRLQPIEGDAAHVWLIVGGEDHKTGHHDDADARFARLEAWTRERFPVVAVDARWSGQVMEPFDFLGFLGRDPSGMEGVFVVTGDSGHGMTHATIGGLLVADLVLGRANPWEALYDPSRNTLSVDAVKAWLHENLDVGAQYLDLLPTGGTVGAADEIPPGTGAILQRGGRKIAAYRDDDGHLSECSAYCSHLGCVVRWNGAERSWDCPCHGSRFSPDGRTVLNGPAPVGLPPLEDRP